MYCICILRELSSACAIQWNLFERTLQKADNLCVQTNFMPDCIMLCILNLRGLYSFIATYRLLNSVTATRLTASFSALTHSSTRMCTCSYLSPTTCSLWDRSCSPKMLTYIAPSNRQAGEIRTTDKVLTRGLVMAIHIKRGTTSLEACPQSVRCSEVPL